MSKSILNIPKKIKFLGIEWIIEYKDDLCYKNNHMGEINYRTHKIYLQNNAEGQPISTPDIEITFLHEIMHLILREMGCEDEGHDEKFVDMLARFLYAMQKDNNIFCTK